MSKTGAGAETDVDRFLLAAVGAANPPARDAGRGSSRKLVSGAADMDRRPRVVGDGGRERERD